MSTRARQSELQGHVTGMITYEEIKELTIAEIFGRRVSIHVKDYSQPREIVSVYRKGAVVQGLGYIPWDHLKWA